MNEPAVKKPLKLAVAGGGTGGHLFPGIALAAEFAGRSLAHSVLFVSRKTAFEEKAVTAAGFDIQKVPSAGIKGKGLWAKIRAMATLAPGVARAALILKRFSPDLVAGLGGYASVPVCLAARLLRIPVVLMEQNIVPGIANKMLARFAKRVYAAFDGTDFGKNSPKVRVLGNPIRPDLMKAAREHWPKPENTPFTLLVLGGSQGARSINRAMVAAVQLLDPETCGRLFVIHQTGAADEAATKEAYEGLGMNHEVRAFFRNMAEIYQKARLVVCRSGASTIAELTAMAKPALFIPFPFAADGHQEKNARWVADKGGGEVIPEADLTPEILAEKIRARMQDPKALGQMAQASGRLGRPQAARDIVDDWLALLGAGGEGCHV